MHNHSESSNQRNEVIALFQFVQETTLFKSCLAPSAAPVLQAKYRSRYASAHGIPRWEAYL